MKKKYFISSLFALVFSIVLFSALYHFDNKYQYSTIKGSKGTLELTQSTKMIYLCDGWEFYQYQLLSPSDFNEEIRPTKYISIGKYLGFDLNNLNDSPYGSATYRLVINTQHHDLKSYTLELPEIFSSYYLWINNELLAQNGNPDPNHYVAELSYGSVTFMAKDQIEIVLAVSNFDHYYSGLIYPMALGQLREVSKSVNTSVIISAMTCFFSLAVGLFYLFVGRYTQDTKIAISFGILCFVYAGNVSHYLVHFISSGYFEIWYMIEDMCYYLMLAGFVFTSALIYLNKNKIVWLYPLFGTMIGLIVVLSPKVLLNNSALFAVCLSILIKLYKVAIIGALIYIVYQAFQQNKKPFNLFLVSVTIFTVSLIVDALALKYDPIRFGWPIEIGGFCMVIALGITITIDAINSFQQKNLLATQNEKLETSYEELTKKIEQAKRNNHDVKHHFAVINKLIQSNEFEGVTSYIAEYTKNIPENSDLHFSLIPSVDAVLRYYYALAKSRNINIQIDVQLPILEEVAQDLCVLFGNLLENAIEACQYLDSEDKMIRFAAKLNNSVILVLADNSFDGTLDYKKGHFYSRKRPETTGIGTTSIRAIADKYNGYSEFKTEDCLFKVSVALKIDK